MNTYGTAPSAKSATAAPSSSGLWALAATAGLIATVALVQVTTAPAQQLYVATQAAPALTASHIGVQGTATRPHYATPRAAYAGLSSAEATATSYQAGTYPTNVPAATATASPSFNLLAVGSLLVGAAAVVAKFLTRSAPGSAPLPPMDMDRVAMAAVSGEPRKRVVVTGMGVASCFGNDVDEFYKRLCEGESAVKLIDKFDTEGFPTKFAAQISDFSTEGLIPPKVDRKYDDVIRYSIVAAKKALTQAGIERATHPDAWEKLDKKRSGVLIGSGMGGLTTMENNVLALGSKKGVKGLSPFTIPYSYANMGGSLVTIEQGFMGPNYSIATACATANYCFSSAADHIRSGRAEVMVAGGSEASVTPTGLGGFVACRALSKNNEDYTKASRPWDNSRDGFVMGEGCGVLVLESEEHALARGADIICEYLGGAITCDAYHVTMPRSDGLGVATCIERAIEDAGIERDQVNYINAHATSTPAGDVAEVNAIKSVFSNMNGIKMNATKSMIGHCLGASGGMEAIATIKAITTGTVHPSMHCTDPVEEIADIDTVQGKAAKHDITAGISNSFGFGGHNSVVVFGPYKKE